MESKTIRAVVFCVVVIILGLWFATLPLLRWWVPAAAEAGDAGEAVAIAQWGQIGDAFGSINALFSGLALAGVVLAVLLQREELKLQRQELRETRAELKRQAEASDRQAGVAEAQLTRAREDDIRTVVRAYRTLAQAWHEFSDAVETVRAQKEVEHYHRKLREAVMVCSIEDRDPTRGALVEGTWQAAKDVESPQLEQASSMIRDLADHVRRLADRLPAIGPS